ncbi:hypothetical protein DFH27DRAFT_481046 [Peziza echinospora]|nr:hypothetical protein DFH27DRAFT_481046 [Peziza echinospora]
MAREKISAAFAAGEPAQARALDWATFCLQPRDPLEHHIMAPLDVMVGEPEPHIILQWTAQVNEGFPPDRRLAPEGPAVEGAFAAGQLHAQAASQAPLPERIRIHSRELALIRRHFAAKGDTRPAMPLGTPAVLLRPFRGLVHDERRWRETLARLETRYAGRKGAEAPPVSDTDTDAGSRDSPSGHETSLAALLHVRCLLRFFDGVIKPKVEHIRSPACRKIHFHDLWNLFKPGDEVVDQAEKQAYRVTRVQIPTHEIADPWQRWFRNSDLLSKGMNPRAPDPPVTVYCRYIDFDGARFGPVEAVFEISTYAGLKDVHALPIYPLRCAKSADLRQRLIARGKMLLDVSASKSMYYAGLSCDTSDEIDSQVVVDFDEALAAAENDDRVPKNCKSWKPDLNALPPLHTRENELAYPCQAVCCMNDAVHDDSHVDTELSQSFLKSLIHSTSLGRPSLILSARPSEDLQADSEGQMVEDEFLVMSYRVLAFVLRSCKWAQLDLTYMTYENMQPRSSARCAFDRLELPEGHREMIKSLVTQHFRDKQANVGRPHEQTDLIRGKGKGLILLLHGAPGVGKTTTAEGAAELFQRPLFHIKSRLTNGIGDLGTTAKEVEAELEKNFSLASRWGCILLLDEADIFLAARERRDFERNGLVAVFLRLLEYYSGILFLTTNRIGDFDEAFASRIHMSLFYPELNESKTRKIFKLNLDIIQERFDQQNRKITYDISSIEDFAEQHFRDHKYSRWNGRQIRNLCQTALALAEFDAHDSAIHGNVDADKVISLQIKYFKQVQKTYLEFGQYLGDIRGTQGDRRAIDFGMRAKTDTPYQTAPSRFSSRGGDSSSGSKDVRHSGMQAQSTIGAQEYKPLVNQGYPVGQNQTMASGYGQYPQQGQFMGQPMGNQGNGMFGTLQIGPYQGGRQGQVDPRLQQVPQLTFSQQGQGWGSQTVDPNFTSAAQSGMSQSGQGQGQFVSGQMQHGSFVNVQNAGSQDPTALGTTPSLQHSGGVGGGGSGVNSQFGPVGPR